MNDSAPLTPVPTSTKIKLYSYHYNYKQYKQIISCGKYQIVTWPAPPSINRRRSCCSRTRCHFRVTITTGELLDFSEKLSSSQKRSCYGLFTRWWRFCQKLEIISWWKFFFLLTNSPTGHRAHKKHELSNSLPFQTKNSKNLTPTLDKIKLSLLVFTICVFRASRPRDQKMQNSDSFSSVLLFWYITYSMEYKTIYRHTYNYKWRN